MQTETMVKKLLLIEKQLKRIADAIVEQSEVRQFAISAACYLDSAKGSVEIARKLIQGTDDAHGR